MHESVANATPRPNEASRVNELFPEQIRGSAENLTNFLKEYYDYMSQEGAPTWEIGHMVSENDIDETSAKYLDSIQDEIAATVPNSDHMDRVTLYKRVVHYYRSKGTVEAVYTFFRIFFNDVDDIHVEYGDDPYTYRIRTTKLPSGGGEWRSKFKKMTHPAGMRFTVSSLVESGAVGGGDLSVVKPGWDANYWFDGDDSQREDYYGANAEQRDEWYYDLLPPNRRKTVETFIEPVLRYTLDSESSIDTANIPGMVVEEVTNTLPSVNGYVNATGTPTWDSTEGAWSFDGTSDYILTYTNPSLQGLDPSNPGNQYWDYKRDSEGVRKGPLHFDEEDPCTVSMWLKTSQSADSILLASRGYNGVALGKFDGKFSLLYIQEGGDSDASDGVPVILQSTTTISDGEWHHLAYVYDGNRSGSLFVDGIKEATDANINLESFDDDGISRQHTFHPIQLMSGSEPTESQGGEGSLHTAGHLKDFRIYSTNLSDTGTKFLFGTGANSATHPYQQLDLDPYTAYFLSKYEPPTQVLVKTLVNVQAGLRWRSTGVDRIEITGDDSDFITNIYGGAGTDVVADIYGDDGDSDLDNSEIFEAPPAELLESRFVSVSFTLKPLIENARDIFVHTQYQRQDKFFDPSGIGSFALKTLAELENNYNRIANQFPVFGADVNLIPHTLKLLYSDGQGGAYLDGDSAGSEGEIIRIQLASRDIPSVGNNVKFEFGLENTNEISADDWALYDGSKDFLIIRPERYLGYSRYFTSGYYYAAGESTSDYLNHYQAINDGNTVGVPLTIEAASSATAITSAQGAWGWGNIASDGSISSIQFVFSGAGFTTTQLMENEYEDYATGQHEPHYTITVGTKFAASSAYVVGDQFFAGDNLYQVTVAGTSGSSAPTHTSSTAANGSLTAEYVGAVAIAYVTGFDETTNDTVGLGGIGDWLWITRGSGYSTLPPDHVSGYEYDKSRFRLGYSHAASHAVRFDSQIQNTIGSSAAESAGVNYRPWYLTGASTTYSSPEADDLFKWHYQNKQMTNGNTSTARLDIVVDGTSEPTGTLTIRSQDYRSLTDTLIIEDSQ